MFSAYPAISASVREARSSSGPSSGNTRSDEALYDFELFPPDGDDDDEGPTVQHIQDIGRYCKQKESSGKEPSGKEPSGCRPSRDPSTSGDCSYGEVAVRGSSSTASTTPTQPSFLTNFIANRSANPLPMMAPNTTSPAAGVSPSSSPRLPSPPPFPEVQIGPKSPAGGNQGKDKILDDTAKLEDGATRRIRPGTKAEHMASGPPLVPLSQLDSPFQLQEHLKALYHTYTKAPTDGALAPITRETARQLATPPESIDRHLWLYELCRFLTMKANNLIIAFFAENPPCSAATCPEMRASEWQYLCAVHDPPKSCCAIDYCCHTLDWATNILTSPKYFPSRLTLGSEAAGGPAASMRHLTNIFRRVYRIFAHAWFQHRAVFWEVEGHDGLYIFFKTVCDVYQLIPEDNYTIPAEAEGLENNLDTPMNTQNPDFNRLSILKKPAENGQVTNSDAHDFAPGAQSNGIDDQPEANHTTVSTGATTRRHKHTPSTGSQVTTIAEGAEEEDSPPSEGALPAHDVELPTEEDNLRPLSREKTVTNLAEAGLGEEKRMEESGTDGGAESPTGESTNLDKSIQEQRDADDISKENIEPASDNASEATEKHTSKLDGLSGNMGTGDEEANEMMEEIDVAATTGR